MSPELQREQDRIVAQVSEYVEAMAAYHQATGKEATRELSAYVNRSLGQIRRRAVERIREAAWEYRMAPILRKRLADVESLPDIGRPYILEP